MKTLSKAAEESVANGAREAVDLVDSGGLTPSAALEKIARRDNWGPNFIRLAGHAYNTGRQTAQREASDSALDKFAEFPVVDPEAVISAIYPPPAEIQKAASDLGISSEYARKPKWLSPAAREKAAEMSAMMQKQAADRPKPEPKSASIEDIYNQHLRLKTAAEEARHAAGVAYDKLLSAMGGLGEYFKQAACDREPFAAVEFAAKTYFGDAGVGLMDYVYKRNRMKEARAADSRMPLVHADFSRAPYKQLRACVELGAGINEKRAAETVAVSELEKHAVDKLGPLVARPRILKRAADSLLPEPDLRYYDIDDVAVFLPHYHKQAAEVVPAAPPEDPWSIMPSEKAADAMDGAILGAGAKAVMDSGGGGGPDNRLADMYMNLEDPAHLSQLRQIRAQAVLTDLMNDEVIGGYQPNEVLQAYNQIANMAPRTADYPMALRALLREHLAAGGNLGAHEVGQVSDMESKLTGAEASPPSHMAISSKKPSPLMSPVTNLLKATGGLSGGMTSGAGAIVDPSRNPVSAMIFGKPGHGKQADSIMDDSYVTADDLL